MFVARWRPDRPWTHVAEKGFILGRKINSPFVILTLPLVWLPLQSDMGLLGQVCLLGWATGPINSTLITLVSDRPSHIYILIDIYYDCIYTLNYLFYHLIESSNIK